MAGLPVKIIEITDPWASSFWFVECADWFATGCHPVHALERAADGAREYDHIDEAESFEVELEAWQNGERKLEDYTKENHESA